MTPQKQLNVFTDFHHAGLLNSLIMLFEGRLGGNLYRPIGEEWYKQGFWHIYDHPATVQQYLGIGGATPDGSPKLNEVEAWVGEGIGRSIPGDGITSRATDATVYYCKDIEGDKTNKAITLDGFLHLPIDIVIASIPQHLEPFKKLCELHPNKPKLVYQIGNAWNVDPNSVKNVMASAIIPNIPEGINFVSYHQEFDLSTFHPQDFSKLPGKNIYSFVNCFNTQDHFSQDWRLFLQLEQLMDDWNFKSFGGQCRDGNCNGSQEVADKMRESAFIWHTKAGGDGFGHVIHSAVATGKPLIVKKEYYRGKMAEALLEDGVTCLTIDSLTPGQIADKIELYGLQENYSMLCREAYERFRVIVDFDQEEKDLRNFLDKLL